MFDLIARVTLYVNHVFSFLSPTGEYWPGLYILSVQEKTVVIYKIGV